MFKQVKDDWIGGHLQGHINLIPSRLIEVFGKPDKLDGYKVSGEYSFKNNNIGFRIYDWKMTTLYDDNPYYKTPKQLWSLNEPITFNIGGETNEKLEEFKHWLNEIVNNKSYGTSLYKAMNDKG